MPVPARCLLFVSFLLVILGGCNRTRTATSDGDDTAKKTELRHQDAQGLKHDLAQHDSTDPGRNSTVSTENGDAKSVVESDTSRSARPSWPRRMGEFNAPSRDRIPLFPVALNGYRSNKNIDFEGKPYRTSGSIRVKDGNEWKGLQHFPRTNSGCSSELFMLRWRLSDPVIHVYSTIDNPRKSTANVATGSYGYMYGTVCDKPQFKFASAAKPNWSNRADVFYELKLWEATP